MAADAADLIERIGMVRRAQRREVATRAGLSLAQLDALAYLSACNRYSDTPAAVAEFLDTTRGTASQSLLALERKGLVVRTGDPRDRRVSHLAPTDAGRRIAARAADDLIGRRVAALGERAGDLAALLEEVLAGAQRERGGRTFGPCGTCVHLRGDAGDHRCGVTGEPLTDAETGLRCAEHAPA